MGVLEAGAHETEVVQTVIQCDAQHRDAQIAHLGEVREPHAAGFVHLAEHHLPFLAIQSAPSADAAFEGATNAGVEFGVAPPQLVEYRHRPDARSCLEQRNDLGLEDIGQRIGPAACARRLLVRRQPRVMPEAVGRGNADSSLRRRRRQRLGELELHEQPHLMIVDVTSRHGWASQKRETPSYRTHRDHRRSAPTGRLFASGGGGLPGYARQPPTPAIFLTLIDALFSP